MTTPYSSDLSGENFLAWLNEASLDHVDLQNLTDAQIIETFRSDKYNLLSPKPNDLGDPTSSTASKASRRVLVSKANRIHRCKIAQMTDDGNFLVLPYEEWIIGSKRQSSIFARQAYKDHWELINHHCMVQKSIERVIISGTPGCGKSVEGIFFINRIFDTFADNPPPILYAASATSTSSLAHFRGFVFTVPDHLTFPDSLAYKVMSANGPVWHIYDSTCPVDKEGVTTGPEIVISSPGRANAKDMKAIRKGRHVVLYLPPPTLDEMHSIRARLFDDNSDSDNYLHPTKMMALIDKFGCVPRTIFDFGNRSIDLDDIEKKLENASDVERLLAMVGSSVVDHEVASGSFVHVVPYHRLSISADGDDSDESDVADEYAFPDDARATMAAARRKRSATEAELPEVGMTTDERIKFLKAQYTTVVYSWASDYIRDKAFQTFIELSADRMMTVILRAQTTELAGFRGLLLEPFVHKLFNETGVFGRFRDLDTGKELGTKKFGPWKIKNVYRDQSELNNAIDVYNVPHKGNEAAIDSLVPWDGLCFQVTTTMNHGINRPGFVKLMDTRIFHDFKKRNPKSPIQFVWVVEKGAYESFKKQDFHNKNKRVYKKNSPLRTYFKGVQQKVFEVDLRRIYEFHHAQKQEKYVEMTSKTAVEKLEKAVKKLAFPTQTKFLGK